MAKLARDQQQFRIFRNLKNTVKTPSKHMNQTYSLSVACPLRGFYLGALSVCDATISPFAHTVDGTIGNFWGASLWCLMRERTLIGRRFQCWISVCKSQHFCYLEAFIENALEITHCLKATLPLGDFSKYGFFAWSCFCTPFRSIGISSLLWFAK